MTEPRYRIRAVREGHPDRWLAFSERKALMMAGHPTQAYHASRASIEALLRQRGHVFGSYSLRIEREAAD